jgi:hypothetical protein
VKRGSSFLSSTASVLDVPYEIAEKDTSGYNIPVALEMNLIELAFGSRPIC